MNRKQRRKANREKRNEQSNLSAAVDFSEVPLATMCQSIQLLIGELRGRGFPIYDFDNKQKVIQGIQIIHGKVFFLAAEDVFDAKQV